MTGGTYYKAKRCIAVISCLVFWFLTGITVTGAQQALASCLSTKGEAAVIACRRELETALYDLDIRFALSDALISLRRHKEAVDVLKEGLARAPGSERIKKKLSLAESYLEEQLWIEKRRAKQAASSDAAATQKLDTETKLNMIRCTKLKGDTALKACNTALQTLPDDPTLYRSKADALMATDRVTEAVLAYREALRLAPDDEVTSNKLLAAQARRSAIATACQQLTGAAALKACDAALLQGAKDEYTIQRRRGDLLFGMERTAEAKEAYRSALDLHPDDLETQKMLDSLTKPATVAKVDETARSQRKPRQQGSEAAQSPTMASTSALSKKQPPKEQPPDILASVKNAGFGETGKGDPKPLRQPSNPHLPIQIKKQYSNKPLVSGITH